MGFNALSVYIMWNYHEVSKGKFDYSTENKNLALFLQLAKKYGFYVLIRPGPYVCAEWDFGGFPARLLNINGIRLRANNAIYLAEVREYFASLVPILTLHLVANGGSIILLQI
jgi:beta-galactosidase